MARILLLLPSAAYRAEDFLDAAAALGAEVAVASDHAQAIRDDRSLVLRFDDPDGAAERIAAFARERPLDAVVAVDDRGVEVAAVAGEVLDLPHNPQGAARAAVDKVRMRRALEASGVPQPAFRVADREDDVAELAEGLGPPVVVKAPALSMSRGVIRADSPSGAAAAAAGIRRILDAAGEDPAGPLLVERYVPGEEVAVEGLLRAGDLEVLAIFDKPEPLEGPIFPETIYTTPSRHPPDTQEAVRGLVAHATRALGLREGPIHAEVRLSPDGPVLLEVAARSIGGLCSRSLRFGAGISLEELILRHALGMPTGDLAREGAASGVLMLPVPAAGTLREVRGQDEARAVPGIEGVTITIGPDQEVLPLPEGDRYLGFVFARGESPEAVEAALRAARDRLDAVIE
jgi:biotin carboxylase